tara:strand:- start:1033 stop:1302 length:270 start_codon:yes stop_codon:yes gene_type:complete
LFREVPDQGHGTPLENSKKHKKRVLSVTGSTASLTHLLGVKFSLVIDAPCAFGINQPLPSVYAQVNYVRAHYLERGVIVMFRFSPIPEL